MAQRLTRAQQDARDEAEERRVFDSKPSLPREQVEKIEPGHYLKLKWLDNDDEVVLVLDVERRPRKKTVERIVVMHDGGNTGSIGFDQILAIVGRHQMPQTPSISVLELNGLKREANERELAQDACCREIEGIHQQAASGLIMVDEFLDKMCDLRKQTPRLQSGDIDIITGLRITQ